MNLFISSIYISRTRYRDLIDSADSIIQMKDLSCDLINSLNNIEKFCIQLSKSRTSDSVDEDAVKHTNNGSKISLRRQYVMGKRIKLLVDTAEQVVSCLLQLTCRFGLH